MHLVAVFDIVSMLSCLAGLAVLWKNSRGFFKNETTLLVSALLMLTLSYNFCLTAEWTGLILTLEPVEDVIGALVPMSWAFVLYALLKNISKQDIQKAHDQLRNNQKQLKALITISNIRRLKISWR